MSKPLGYFSLDARNNSLLKDIEDTWANTEDMATADILWLIARIAHEAWQAEPTNSAPSDEAEEVVDRLTELSFNEKLGLLQWLSQ